MAPRTKTSRQSHSLLLTVAICAEVAVGIAVAVLANDVIIGVIVGALSIGVTTQIAKLSAGHGKVRHP